MHEQIATPHADGSLSQTEVRALLHVAIDLAEDLEVDSAVVVVDPAGSVLGAERPGVIAHEHLDLAIETARRALTHRARELEQDRACAIVLRLDGVTHGALAVAGGPEGFALAACRASATALGL